MFARGGTFQGCPRGTEKAIEEAADPLCKEGAEVAGNEILGVDHYEVVTSDFISALSNQHHFLDLNKRFVGIGNADCLNPIKIYTACNRIPCIIC